ncbi:YheC/YheD family protein [Ammoniphilus sp. YIM 78166]|uniref:YheC/YheD family protein n=1 Tax=Ammoniphilus sp. YIM 78166 TaxID=1644106 RepID=UPI00142FEE91|nr:YheC/YheD family protein [Ammoniphilus sp. YIM 78166]
MYPKRRYQYVASKWKKTQLLLENEAIRPYIPDTLRLTRENLIQMLLIHSVVYLKPENGMKGNGIIRIDYDEEVEVYIIKSGNDSRAVSSIFPILQWLKRKTAGHKYLIQQGIDLISLENKPIDFRVLLQKPKKEWVYAGIVGKLGEPNSITTNLAQGGKAISFREALSKTLELSVDEMKELKDELEQLSLIIANQLTLSYPGLRELGIDFAIDIDGSYWVLEVNTSPGHQLFKQLPNDKIYKRIIQNVRAINFSL